MRVEVKVKVTAIVRVMVMVMVKARVTGSQGYRGNGTGLNNDVYGKIWP